MIIGIDPGKNGAIAFFFESEGSMEVQSLPTDVKEARYFLIRTFRCLPKSQYIHIFIENVHASPQMGVVSAFSFGRRFEMLLSICDALDLAYRLLKPQVWQNAIGILSGGDKTKLYHKAKSLFPQLRFKKSEADALLIMHYGCKVLEYGGGEKK